ncbi:hypothetical protein [Brucella inopinata]|uniref:Uncharacterized protein n=1 Tax=Brucella inopinata TaxID=1218315 RepID=A0AAW7AXK5_9HYPH|nr:hypothetical protein [Brucella inopinata]MDL2331660.1 hypothetical protein [Brucella inopinata]
MHLFSRKTLRRYIKVDPIPSDHRATLEAWAELINSGRIERLKETALHGQFGLASKKWRGFHELKGNLYDEASVLYERI